MGGSKPVIEREGEGKSSTFVLCTYQLTVFPTHSNGGSKLLTSFFFIFLHCWISIFVALDFSSFFHRVEFQLFVISDQLSSLSMKY